MRKSDPIWVFAIIAIFVALILNIVFSMRISETKKIFIELSTEEANINLTKKTQLQGRCPDSIGGGDQSDLRVKYFYSDYCPWCKKEEPILQKLVEDYGGLVNIAWYEINSCPELVKEYEIGGVPTFVFSTINNQTEYLHYGFIYEKDLRKMVCDVTEGC